MSFSSRRRNYLLTHHRRDGLIEWMKSMLMHSFVLDALDTTGADTFSHFEMLIEEHREICASEGPKARSSRLIQLVPTCGTFHTYLPLRRAFDVYNAKYGLTKRKHICISFNELRHILNLAQIMALCSNYRRCYSTEKENEEQAQKHLETLELQSAMDLLHSPAHLAAVAPEGCPPSLNLNGNGSDHTRDAVDIGDSCQSFRGPTMITFDGDQTLYSDGANFESNQELAQYLYLLVRNGVTVAVVTAAGYEYQTEKYELRLSGLLAFFKDRGMSTDDCERFYLFGGECNYLLRLGSDFRLHAVKETGTGGWQTATRNLDDAPGNWDELQCTALLDMAEECMQLALEEQRLKARLIRKKRSVGLVPLMNELIPREALDETILRVQSQLRSRPDITLPFCAFNGGRDAWLDCGNKRVGVEVLQTYLGVPAESTLHIGDQFLNTGNDFAAREICPCVWITSPEETTYILKSILRLAGVPLNEKNREKGSESHGRVGDAGPAETQVATLNLKEVERRNDQVKTMDVFTGEMITKS